MSLPAVNDFAMVTHECGCPRSGHYLGQIFRVTFIQEPADHHCGLCSRLYAGSRAAFVNDSLCFKHEWLTKIEPITERETLTESEIAKHPAVIKVILWDEGEVRV